MAADTECLIFLVDDDPRLTALVERWLIKAGYEVNVLPDGESCLEALTEELPSAVCLDLGLPGLSGMQTLEQIRARNPFLPVLVLTGDGAVDSVVRAMKLGAYDYLTKPIDETKLLTTLKNATEHHRLSIRVSQLEREAEGRGYPGIVGVSPAMRKIFRQLDRLAVSDITILIHGESGTGKELIARAVHEASGRKQGPFVPVNSAAIPESLMESELFGHERGAFTGASNRRIGRFEEANHGSLFLDEIGELSASVQAKLLRVLQERSFQRLGGSATLSSDFRLVSATHRNLAEDVKAGRFREDLYFRLAVFELEIPPLRERKEDIPLLAELFVLQHAGSLGSTADVISAGAMQALCEYAWPGNVRELQNVIQRALVVAEGQQVVEKDLPERLLGQNTSLASPSLEPTGAVDTLEDASRKLLVNALTKHAGNASAAMRELNVGRTRFYRMLKKFGLEGRVGEMRQAAKAGERSGVPG
jgi:two-component system NtrC family response regulator